MNTQFKQTHTTQKKCTTNITTYTTYIITQTQHAETNKQTPRNNNHENAQQRTAITTRTNNKTNKDT